MHLGVRLFDPDAAPGLRREVSSLAREAPPLDSGPPDLTPMLKTMSARLTDRRRAAKRVR